MINYTTPTITMIVKGVDLTGKDVYVSLEQKKNVVHKKNDFTITVSAGGDSTIEMTLTQEESASFDLGSAVNIQINWIDANDVREATVIKRVPVMRNILNKVISYGA